MKYLRKYSDLTEDAKRIYDGVLRKIKKIEAVSKPLRSIIAGTKKYDEATRRKAGDRVTRLSQAKWKLEQVRADLMGRRESWYETGVPVRVAGQVRIYPITSATQFGHVSLGDGYGTPRCGTIDLDAFPADTDALFRVLGQLESDTLAAAESALRRVERRDEGLKPKKDVIAHWKEPGLP